MKKNKISFNTRLDPTILDLINTMTEITYLNKTGVIETAVFEFAQKNMPPETFKLVIERNTKVRAASETTRD